MGEFMLSKVTIFLQKFLGSAVVMLTCLMIGSAFGYPKYTMTFARLDVIFALVPFMCFKNVAPGDKINIKKRFWVFSGLCLSTCAMLILGVVGCTYTAFIFALIVCEVFTILALPCWWDNIKKFLFLNKLIDPSKYEFLLTFDVKNEVLKYFGTLRELKGKKAGKAKFFMIISPLLVLSSALCIMVTAIFRAYGSKFSESLVRAAFVLWFNGTRAGHTFFSVSALYVLLRIYSMTFVNVRANKQFYGRPKNKKAQNQEKN